MDKQFSGNTLSDYLENYGSHDLLTPEEEVALITASQAGDKESLERLIMCNQRLVIKVASKYLILAGDQELSDLIQWGNEGLLRAIERFELRGWRFSTYAQWWIRSVIRRNALNHGNSVHVPFHNQEDLFHIRQSRASLCQSLGREPTEAEIAADMGMPVKKVMELLPALQQIVSLDMSFHDGEAAPCSDAAPRKRNKIDALADCSAPSPEECAETALTVKTIRDNIKHLDKRSQRVLAYRFGLDGCDPMNLDQIGERENISRERVRQIEHHALSKLKYSLNFPGSGVFSNQQI